MTKPKPAQANPSQETSIGTAGRKRADFKSIGFGRFLLPLTLSVLFYGVMLFFTLFAEPLHDALLPRVTALPLSRHPFTYEITRPNGTVSEAVRTAYALPQELVESGLLFELVQSKKDGKPYYTVRRIYILEFGELQNGYYEVTTSPDRLYSLGSIVISGYETLEDGDEVFWQK